MSNTNNATASSQSWRQCSWKICSWFLKFGLGSIAVYLSILLLGLIPVNNDFQPTPGGVKLLLRSNSVHADFVMPMVNDVIDWRSEFPAVYFDGDVGQMTHVAVGWGDKGFFINTPTWDDLKFSTALNALLIPSATCLHVAMTREQLLPTSCQSIEISNEQYQELVKYIRSSFKFKNGMIIAIPDAMYGTKDAFFEARGYYHALNTCNSWVGGGLKAASVKTPWLTPMPKSPFLYLPKSECKF